ncbi:Fic family protein [Terrilactibacillus laevilacticus]|uniref:Fic family protein n=1 Tax=Terrilactibacillus laevilacticus TaxID=1380157 RepID=UPI00114785B7|nr:Fic family protein [Terrilactibacillus laevilacticus]
MARQGLAKLPVSVDIPSALTILQLLPQISNKIGRLESDFKHSVVSDALVQILSLSESVESTRIEGTQVTFTDMIEEKDNKNPRLEIKKVSNYQHALMTGFERIRNGYPISTRLIKELHQLLMEGARGSTQASGEFRKIQNFIGPTNKIEDASYIPITSEKINEYMENLEYFINGHPYGVNLSINQRDEQQFIFDEHANELIKTAILHAQFESIHPFLDGNGRLGRILIALHLMQSKVISQPIFFVSEELEKERPRYYEMLNAVRGKNPNWGDWILFFLNASDRMSDRLIKKLSDAEVLAHKGLGLCGTDSEGKVWLYTFSNPFTTTSKAAVATRLSPNTTRKALKSLVDKKLLFTDSETLRNKKYDKFKGCLCLFYIRLFLHKYLPCCINNQDIRIVDYFSFL